MPGFRRLSESELARRSDDELIAYMRAARDAGEPGGAGTALALLVNGHVGLITRRMRMKVPAPAVEDLARDALVEAIDAAFSGESVGSFRAWLDTIVRRQIADFYRTRARRPDPGALPEGAEETGLLGVEPSADEQVAALDAQAAIDTAVAGLSDQHREVVELYIFGPFSARETAGRIPGMTADNVAQIASRFRKRLREILDSGDTSP